MRILIAYDGSPAADLAVEQVARRPWPAGSEVRVVSVLEPSPPMPPEAGVEVYGPVFEKIRVTQRQAMQETLDRAAERIRAGGTLQVDAELREGGVNRSLLEAIKQFGADLVVAGSHGHTALERFFLGSVSHALVTHAPCSVEIVKASHP